MPEFVRRLARRVFTALGVKPVRVWLVFDRDPRGVETGVVVFCSRTRWWATAEDETAEKARVWGEYCRWMRLACGLAPKLGARTDPPDDAA